MSSLPVKDLLVTVTESFEDTQHISRCLEPCGPNPACFHYPKYFQPQIHVEVPKSQWSSVVGGCGSRGLGAGSDSSWEEPLPSRNRPSFQLCRCNAYKNDPVCQSLDCLPDGQAVTLPVVRAWVWEGVPEQRSLECLWKGDGESLGTPAGSMARGGSLRQGYRGLKGKKIAELHCGAKDRVRKLSQVGGERRPEENLCAHARAGRCMR